MEGAQGIVVVLIAQILLRVVGVLDVQQGVLQVAKIAVLGTAQARVEQDVVEAVTHLAVVDVLILVVEVPVLVVLIPVITNAIHLARLHVLIVVSLHAYMVQNKNLR